MNARNTHRVLPIFDENSTVGEGEPLKCARFVESVRVTIVNRWGREVFEYDSDDGQGENTILIDWDGRSNEGTPLASGVYYYVADVVFDVLDPETAEEQFSGWVHLRR